MTGEELFLLPSFCPCFFLPPDSSGQCEIATVLNEASK
jgi:hypothetical protein